MRPVSHYALQKLASGATTPPNIAAANSAYYPVCGPLNVNTNLWRTLPFHVPLLFGGLANCNTIFYVA